MPALISGSLAFDSIASFQGRFADQIMADQLHILNVSFFVPTLKREFGGCAGNIAYALQQLGGQAILLAAVGHDGGSYVERMRSLGVDTQLVYTVRDQLTAQAFIITDQDNNQITAFHPGAMEQAHLIQPQLHDGIHVAIIGPDGKQAMMSRAEQLSASQIPFIYDPGQQLPMFSAEEHQQFIDKATWVTVNDYEARMLVDRLGTSLQSLSELEHLRGVIVTLGAEGCDVWQAGQCTHVDGHQAERIQDPTGCGDAFRGALLYGIERGWDLTRCAALGNQLGAIKIAHSGPQNYTLTGRSLHLQ